MAFYLPLPSLYAFSLFTTVSSRSLLGHRSRSQTTAGTTQKSRSTPTGSKVAGIRVAREVKVELSERLTEEDRVYAEDGIRVEGDPRFGKGMATFGEV